MARRGYDLVMVARNCARLDGVARRLTDATGRAIAAAAADRNDKAALGQIETLLRTEVSITMPVNNAGVGVTHPLLAADVDKMDAMIARNVTVLTRLTCAAAPGPGQLVRQGIAALLRMSR